MLTDAPDQRAHNVKILSGSLESIRSGSDVNALAWAAGIYLCLQFDLDDSVDGRQRLIQLSNEALADALLEGFSNYLEQEIPSDKEILAAGATNTTPYTHILVSLSLYHRLKRGLEIPHNALSACVAAAITTTSYPDGAPDLEEVLLRWLKAEAANEPKIVATALRAAWELGAAGEWLRVHRFFELQEDETLRPLLLTVAGDVLEGPASSDLKTVQELLPFLLTKDPRRALLLAEREASRPDLPIGIKALWETALFVLSPVNFESRWTTFSLGGPTFEWEILDLLRGDSMMKRMAPALTLSQRGTVIRVIGTRCINTPPATGVWSGHHNPWDAAEFVEKQIQILALNDADDGERILEGLRHEPKLASYHQLIDNHLAQRAKRVRDLTFVFSSPNEIAAALQNLAPATSRDLLAYVIDHLRALDRELKTTQMEAFHAFWNLTGKSPASPKHEEVCSALLAADLQKRIRPHNLVVAVEHHMVADKECDIVVLQGQARMLPIEAKHHYHDQLWTGWRDQLDKLYTRDAAAGGLGVYLVYWSGEAKGRMMPKLPPEVQDRPSNAMELKAALESLIPLKDRSRLRIVIVDISPIA